MVQQKLNFCSKLNTYINHYIFASNFRVMEFKEYEKAIAKYHKNLTLMSLPLKSWSFYSSFFDKAKMAIGDASLLESIVSQNKWEATWSFNEQLQNDTVIVVTDATLNIVFASKNIVDMNGYIPEEVIGNSPKMFQGILTNDKVSREISTAVKEQKPFDKVIINYCKDGSIYKCHIKGYPVFNKKGKLINFIAFEKIAA